MGADVTRKTRSGPVWDAAEGRAPLPPAAATVGLEVLWRQSGYSSFRQLRGSAGGPFGVRSSRKL
jgi:hypothetical protein